MGQVLHRKKKKKNDTAQRETCPPARTAPDQLAGFTTSLSSDKTDIILGGGGNRESVGSTGFLKYLLAFLYLPA